MKWPAHQTENFLNHQRVPHIKKKKKIEYDMIGLDKEKKKNIYLDDKINKMEIEKQRKR